LLGRLNVGPGVAAVNRQPACGRERFLVAAAKTSAFSRAFACECDLALPIFVTEERFSKPFVVVSMWQQY
jgi:hypothetical protein